MTLTITELPPRVTQYLASYFATLKNLKLADRYHVQGEQRDALVELIGRAFLKEFSAEEFPAKVGQAAGLPTAQAFLLSADIADQHFKAYADYLGPLATQGEQWRSWGREFGGREPGAKASPRVEAMISKAAQVGPATSGIDLARQKRPQQAASSAPATRQAPVEATNQAAVPLHSPTPKPAPVPAAQPTQAGMSREQFFDQVRSFSIEKMRPAGQPAVQRLAQVRDSLQRVVASNPADQPVLAQALRQSPLFRLYQEMGQESLRTQQPIDHVIYTRYQSTQPYLLREEFDAVGQLAAIATPAAQPQPMHA